MHLLRCLFFFSASFEFRIYAKHIRGKHNELADALSRNNLRLFQELRPTVAQPTPIPSQLVELLITTKPDWLSQDWRHLFRNICNIHQQSRPAKLIWQHSNGTSNFVRSLTKPLSPYTAGLVVLLCGFLSRSAYMSSDNQMLFVGHSPPAFSARSF